MVKNIYLLLGLPEGAPWSEVKVAYAKFMESICSSDADDESPSASPLREARKRLTEAWQHAHVEQPAPSQTGYTRPKLGQLLVAGGLIELSQLDSMLEIQRNTKTEHVQIGSLLVASGYITERQLDYYLRMQEVLKLPADHPQRWGQRLIELGLVSEDQLKVALIEQKTTGCTLREALINRGWLDASTLDRIF